jgi:hypothetical protein
MSEIFEVFDKWVVSEEWSRHSKHLRRYNTMTLLGTMF